MKYFICEIRFCSDLGDTSFVDFITARARALIHTLIHSSKSSLFSLDGYGGRRAGHAFCPFVKKIWYVDCQDYVNCFQTKMEFSWLFFFVTDKVQK